MHKELAFFGGARTANPDRCRFEWPRISDDGIRAVMSQLEDTISIYDRSSVFLDFEQSFAEYHNAKYGLVSNSGTSSLFSVFDALRIKPGDEVVCPVYTFHATVSPLMNFGAIPIFADCDESGNVSLESVTRKVSDKTKAVVVTHMWGVPVPEIEGISKFCSDEGIPLIEDCSHAHGAMLGERLVGSFGTAAVWSLQGQKIISGGEGGILLTDDSDLYHEALLHGHYNKRPKSEIPSSSKKYKFYLTGKGLKLRAHPLAIALAAEQFSKFSSFQNVKNEFANELNSCVDRYSFLSRFENPHARNSWYALGIHFDQDAAGGITREQFVALLHAEGLIEFDIPGSTGLLNNLPLFTHPHELFPHLYNEPLQIQGGFQKAREFTSTFIKLPVWAYESDREIVALYIEGISKVADCVTSVPDLSVRIADLS